MSLGKIKLYGDWHNATSTLTNYSQRYGKVANQAVYQEALYLAGEVRKGIIKQRPGKGPPFLPLSKWTIASRQLKNFSGTKALIHKADLLNSIDAHKIGNQVLVGVLRTATNSRGGSLVNIGYVQEFGSRPILIHVTPKMARYLFVLQKKLGITHGKKEPGETHGAKILVIKIPARPFLRPVWDALCGQKDIGKRILDRMKTLLDKK
jgi:hypothetical protein